MLDAVTASLLTAFSPLFAQIWVDNNSDKNNHNIHNKNTSRHHHIIIVIINNNHNLMDNNNMNDDEDQISTALSKKDPLVFCVLDFPSML